MKGVTRFFLLLLPMVFHTGAALVPLQEINYKSYTLLLHSFAKNIEWPAEASRTSFVYGVYGQSGVYNELITLSKTKRVRNLPIEVRKLTTPAEAVNCDIVFIPAARSSVIKDVNVAIDKRSVLLVCERSGYCLKGGAISFTVDDDGALRFDINTKVCTEKRLRVSPQLLQIADRVY